VSGKKVLWAIHFEPWDVAMATRVGRQRLFAWAREFGVETGDLRTQRLAGRHPVLV